MSGSPDGFQASKAALREAVLARRDQLDPVQRIEMSIAAAAHGERHIGFDPGSIVSGFLPIRSELDLRPLMDSLRVRGARLCVPVVIDRQTITFRELVRGAELVKTGFGTVGPGAEATILDPQLLLMPLSVFDRFGNRIGYGAGHYDRAIAKLRAAGGNPRLIGCGFAMQEADLVPAEPHDITMHGVLTENGYREFGSQ